MPLLEHQIALGRCLRAPGADALTSPTFDPLQGLAVDSEEATQLADVVRRPGFGFTRRIQRFWCRGRAAWVARLTLSSLPAERRHQLINDWVEAGGSTSFDPAVEAGAFLDFIESRLTGPSHTLTLCQTERAAYRASEAALRFRAPSPSLLDDCETVLQASADAALVRFFAEPERLLAAIEAGTPLPPISNRVFPVLFAPGLAALVRAVRDEEEALWEQLARPATIPTLLRSGHTRQSIAELLSIGAAQPVLRSCAGTTGTR